jgi:hypothetical protein
VAKANFLAFLAPHSEERRESLFALTSACLSGEILAAE